MFTKILSVIILVLLFASCASVEVTKITPQNKDEEGIRFYRPYPYLLVVQKTDSIEYRIIWLPKVDEEYAFKVHSGFGTTEYTINLENGWMLNSFNEKRDSKLTELVTSALGNATDILKSQSQQKQISEQKEKYNITSLYALIFEDTGPEAGLIKGLRKIKSDSVTVENK